MEKETLSLKEFWKSISILIHNYHAVNRKIFSCVIGEVQKITQGIEHLSATKKQAQAIERYQLEDLKGNAKVSCGASALSELQTWLESADQSEEQCEGFAVLSKFLTKKLENNIEAMGIVDFTSSSYTCRFLGSNLDDFSVKFQDNQIVVEILTKRLDVERGTRWAEYVLKPKLLKWSKSQSEAAADGDAVKQKVRSLQLVDNEEYNDLYKELKRKYAEKALKFWNDAKESTDPLKFIYEDLAIASYLITLWRSPACSSPLTAFVDLGCGNGLLVYILNEEGYKGYGYDIRARKLWSFYPNTTRLIEQAIEPSAFKNNLPTEVDWLIGNHSDELSPWLPVLAATARFGMSYFLLPCCAYELSGAKFQRRNTSTSVYQDFYAYARTISAKCGFKTLEDRLKIPSTKRLALVGIERFYTQSEYESKRRDIQAYVTEERKSRMCGGNQIKVEEGVEVKLREKHEAVRNCTQIDKTIIAELVEKIFKLLLAARNSESVVMADDSNWLHGGRLTMRDIVQNLTKDDLKHIKSECGGIKTLLRNKHEIFEFCGNDLIAIRRPVGVQAFAATTTRRPQTIKKRFCFFKQHHPNGCPLADDVCTFVH